MISKGNDFYEPKGQVNDMEVSRLACPASQLGFLTLVIPDSQVLYVMSLKSPS